MAPRSMGVATAPGMSRRSTQRSRVTAPTGTGLRVSRRAGSFSTRIAVALNSCGAGLRIGGVDGQQVRGDVVLKVQRHEGEARAERRIVARAHLDRATP